MNAFRADAEAVGVFIHLDSRDFSHTPDRFARALWYRCPSPDLIPEDVGNGAPDLLAACLDLLAGESPIC